MESSRSQDIEVAAIRRLHAMANELDRLADSLGSYRSVEFSDVWPAEKGDCKMRLPLFLGVDRSDEKRVFDLVAMPHLLIGGVEESNRDNLLNSIIVGLSRLLPPNNLRFVLYGDDTPSIGFGLLRDLPHLAFSIIRDFFEFIRAVGLLLHEMKKRQKMLSDAACRDIEEFSARGHEMPYIVVVIKNIDDLIEHPIYGDSIDLGPDIEELLKKAHFVGIHIVAATQYASERVRSASFLSHFHCRGSFKVRNRGESIVFIDTPDMDSIDADVLCNSGDMLLRQNDGDPIRVQCAFLSEMKIWKHLNGLKSRYPVGQPPSVNMAEEFTGAPDHSPLAVVHEDASFDYEELYNRALSIIRETERASTSHLQRRMGIGFNRASHLIDMLKERGVIDEKYNIRGTQCGE